VLSVEPPPEATKGIDAKIIALDRMKSTSLAIPVGIRTGRRGGFTAMATVYTGVLAYIPTPEEIEAGKAELDSKGHVAFDEAADAKRREQARIRIDSREAADGLQPV
jgi:hypothetical protein